MTTPLKADIWQPSVYYIIYFRCPEVKSKLFQIFQYMFSIQSANKLLQTDKSLYLNASVTKNSQGSWNGKTKCEDTAQK